MALQVSLIVLLSIGAVGKGANLLGGTRRRASTALLSASLALLAVGQLLSIPALTALVDRELGDGTGKAFNGLIMSGLCVLIVFFLLARKNSPARRRAVGGHVIVLVAALAALTLTMLLTPPADRGHTVSSAAVTQAPVAAFYFVGGGYFVYAYGLCAVWTWNYMRGSSGALRSALFVVTLGLGTLAMLSVARMVYVGAHALNDVVLAPLNTVNRVGSEVATILLVIGLFVLGVAQVVPAARLRAQRQGQTRRLRPLWELLTDLYPEIVLPVDGSGIRTAFTRRVLECRDGLLRLAPTLAVVSGEADLAAADAEQLARWVKDAARYEILGKTAVVAPSSSTVAAPSVSTLDGDAERLVAISICLEELG